MQERQLTVKGVKDAPHVPLVRHKWLRSGKQTTLTLPTENFDEAKLHLRTFFDAVRLVGRVIDERRGAKVPFDSHVFRKRDVNEMLTDRSISFGCQAHALVAATLFRHLGVPAKFVETFNLTQSRTTAQERRIAGHCYVKIRHPSGKWVFYDGTKNLLVNNEKEILPEYTWYAEGLDDHDIGIRSFEDTCAAVIKLQRMSKLRLFARKVKRRLLDYLY